MVAIFFFFLTVPLAPTACAGALPLPLASIIAM
jgi:hypothetical protein